MTLLINISLLLGGLLVFIEDVRYRLVTVWKILFVAAVSTLLFVFTSDYNKERFEVMLMNFGVIAVIYMSLVAVNFIRERRLDFALKNKIGFADLLLVIPPAVCFSNILFMYFILGSVFFGIIYAVVLFCLRRDKITVPLAGISSLLFAIAIIAFSYLNIDISDNAALFLPSTP